MVRKKRDNPPTTPVEKAPEENIEKEDNQSFFDANEILENENENDENESESEEVSEESEDDDEDDEEAVTQTKNKKKSSTTIASVSSISAIYIQY